MLCFRPPILRSQMGKGWVSVYTSNQRHWEVCCIQDMIYMIMFVRRLGYGVFEGLQRRMAYGLAGVVVKEVMTAIAEWSLILSLFYFIRVCIGQYIARGLLHHESSPSPLSTSMPNFWRTFSWTFPNVCSTTFCSVLLLGLMKFFTDLLSKSKYPASSSYNVWVGAPQPGQDIGNFARVSCGEWP